MGLGKGDAHILRNAGGIVTEDVIRSLVISHHLLGTEEIMIINHTDCGLMGRSEEELRRLVISRTGSEAVAAPSRFFTFNIVEENVRDQIQKLRRHPWIPQNIPVRGFVYDVTKGRLIEVPQ